MRAQLRVVLVAVRRSYQHLDVPAALSSGAGMCELSAAWSVCVCVCVCVMVCVCDEGVGALFAGTWSQLEAMCDMYSLSVCVCVYQWL